jgi:acetyl esterase
VTHDESRRFPPEIDLDRLLSPQAARSAEYQAVWDWMVDQDKALPDQSRMTIVEQRAIRAMTSGRWNADPPEMASVEAISVPGEEGRPPVSCELHVPFDAKPGGVLYLHGGGWVFGDLRSHTRLARNLAIATQRPALVVDYRLAPEHPFPAALDDALAAWRWLVAAGQTDKRLAGPLAIAGDSAGANLGVGAMFRELCAKGRLPVCGLFFYGVYSGDLASPSYLRFTAGHGLSRGGMEQYWRMYAGEPDAQGRWRNPLVSPIDADGASLAALPPLHLAAAHLDPLLCDTLAFAQRVRQAGGHCGLVVHEGVQHGFVQITARLEEARRAIRVAGDFLRSAIGEA